MFNVTENQNAAAVLWRLAAYYRPRSELPTKQRRVAEYHNKLATSWLPPNQAKAEHEREGTDPRNFRPYRKQSSITFPQPAVLPFRA